MFLRATCTAIVLIMALPAGAADEPGSGEPAQMRECHTNFEVEGSFFRGKTFRTKETLGEVVVEDAVKRMGREIVKRGYEGVDVNTELGTISAHQGVSFGKGKTVPLNVVLESSDGEGVVAEIVVQLSGGLGTDKDEVRTEFCEILAEGKESRTSSSEG
ncbi:MAG: hypothetical protein ACLF0P_05985 [Thermoanaerobaculia bacterium]